MTRQENIATLNEHLYHWKRLLSEKICDQSEGEKTIDALQNAIKALEQQPTDAVDRVTIKEYLESFGNVKTEQEPCEDVVSRLAVLDALDKSKYSNEFCEEHHIDWSINLGMAYIVVNELKPVTPQQKMGKWIKDKCSICGEERAWYGQNPPYCPDCGAKMQEVEE